MNTLCCCCSSCTLCVSLSFQFHECTHFTAHVSYLKCTFVPLLFSGIPSRCKSIDRCYFLHFCSLNKLVLQVVDKSWNLFMKFPPIFLLMEFISEVWGFLIQGLERHGWKSSFHIDVCLREQCLKTILISRKPRDWNLKLFPIWYMHRKM